MSRMNLSSTSDPNGDNVPSKKSVIVPLEVQKSIMEWLDEDLPNDSPARVARALGMPAHAFAAKNSSTNGNANNNHNRSMRGGPSNSSQRSKRNRSPQIGGGDNNNNNADGGTTTAASTTQQTQGGTTTSPNKQRVRGTRRQRQKEHTHVFVENPDLPAIHPANSIWLYGSFEYKLQTPPDEAQRTVFRIISRLVERMQRLLDASTAAVARGDTTNKESMRQMANAAEINAMMPPLPSTVLGGMAKKGDNNNSNNDGGDHHAGFSTSGGGGITSNKVLPANHPLQGAVTGGRFRAKGHLVFDLISTRKHITDKFQNGLPYRLGEEIYEHCQRKYVDCIATCFVGLTDNPAQRVGRDIFYQKSDDLSTSHLSFMNIDYGHLFVVFPPDSKRLRDTPSSHQNNNNTGRSRNNNNEDSNDNNNNNLNTDFYDETNTRFLADALSGHHDLTGSTIPGRPPPLSSLAATRKQQEEAMLRYQQNKAEKAKQMRSTSSRGHHNNNNNNNSNVMTGRSAGNNQEAASMIAMHRHMFSNSPSGRKVQVKGSNANKHYAAGGGGMSPSSPDSSPNTSPQKRR